LHVLRYGLRPARGFQAALEALLHQFERQPLAWDLPLEQNDVKAEAGLHRLDQQFSLLP
jgi:hypothetical protein